MFSSEFFEVLKQILRSWQVIAVTVVLILYLYIVSYASRSYHPKRARRIRLNLKRSKSKPAAVAENGPEEAESSVNINDELGLEEA